MDYQPGRILPLLGAALIAVVAGSACSGPPAAVPASAPHAQSQDGWPGYAAGFIEAYLKSEPFIAVRAGRHEYDGQMPDHSAAGIAAQVERLKTWRAAASAFDAGKLSPDERFEREHCSWSSTRTSTGWTGLVPRSRIPPGISTVSTRMST